MVNQIIVGMLVRKINDKEVNPITNDFFCLDDIKIQSYKDAVQAQLNM